MSKQIFSRACYNRFLLIGSFLIFITSRQLLAQPPPAAAQVQAPLPLQPALPQEPYWQQQTDFDIRVTLNDNDHSLQGFETIRYTNHSPDTLTFLYIHCWPN